jgi:hypothetical protein
MDPALITILSSAGVAGVFCVLFITGLIYPRAVVSDLKAENVELKAALEAERDRASTLAAVQFGQALSAGPRP